MNTESLYIFFNTYLPGICVHLFHSVIIVLIFGIIYHFFSCKGKILCTFANKFGLEEDHPLIKVISKICRFIIVLIALLTLAQEWEYNLSAVLASLGVGSLALAMAAQDYVKNFFGAFIVFAEKPFVIGDKITVTGLTGVVEAVNFRSTVIRTETGDLIYIPNSVFTGSAITNCKK